MTHISSVTTTLVYYISYLRFRNNWHFPPGVYIFSKINKWMLMFQPKVQGIWWGEKTTPCWLEYVFQGQIEWNEENAIHLKYGRSQGHVVHCQRAMVGFPDLICLSGANLGYPKWTPTEGMCKDWNLHKIKPKFQIKFKTTTGITHKTGAPCEMCFTEMTQRSPKRLNYNKRKQKASRKNCGTN